jgi:hypothetical protein
VAVGIDNRMTEPGANFGRPRAIRFHS